MNPEQARFNMIEQQIRTWHVLDAQVLSVFKLVNREHFVPAAYKALAYTESPIPISAHEVMLSPVIQARLVQDLGVKPSDSVLDVGCGSGYTTALLAHLADKVLGLEIDPILVKMAQAALGQEGMANAHVLQQDASSTSALDQRFDAILMGGSCARAPVHLLQALQIGGKLLGIFGYEPLMQATLVTRTGETQWEENPLWDTCAPRLHGFAESSAFHF
jgi:protein-L-isoaspartate(D-aspartate) O-methyltransferase